MCYIKDIKITVRYIDWEQVNLLDKYWELFSSYIDIEKIVGLGMNWRDYLYFNYAIGVINYDITLSELKKIDF